MRAHQEIRMTVPTAGSAPKNLAMVMRTPKAPRGPVRFTSFKDAMEYLKKKEEEIDEDKE